MFPNVYLNHVLLGLPFSVAVAYEIGSSLHSSLHFLWPLEFTVHCGCKCQLLQIKNKEKKLEKKKFLPLDLMQQRHILEECKGCVYFAAWFASLEIKLLLLCKWVTPCLEELDTGKKFSLEIKVGDSSVIQYRTRVLIGILLIYVLWKKQSYMCSPLFYITLEDKHYILGLVWASVKPIDAQ